MNERPQSAKPAKPSKAKSLWGTLPSAEAVDTPLSILAAAAAELGSATAGKLRGEVLTDNFGDRRKDHALRIRSDALPSYTQHVLTASCPVGFYPVSVSGHELKDASAFRSAVAAVLQNETTRAGIASVLTQLAAAED